MKKIYFLFLLMFSLSLGKVFSQSCISFGCAASHTGVVANGTLPDLIGSGGVPGSCYGGSPYKQVFWQFFYSPTGGNFTQAYTATSVGDPLDLDYIVFDIGVSAPSSTVCPVDQTGWTELICNVAGGTVTGPGEPSPFGDVLATTAGHYYAIAIVFYQGTDPSYTFDIGNPQIGGSNLTGANCINIVLPVKLYSFDAKVNSCAVNLNWVAQSEANFKHYEVEYSADGSRFQTVATIAGFQSDNSNQKYSYEHIPQQGRAYYRLKMTDIDGKFEYSKIIALKLDCNRSSTFVYPNPVTDVLNVNITNAQNNTTTASLFDNNGKLIYSGKMVSGTNTIDMSNFAKGVYLLKLKNNLETQNIKIIK